MKIHISEGHTLSGKGTGAVGFINESKENRVLGKYVVEYLKKMGHNAEYHEVNQANDYINQQAKKANEKSYDLVVQIHFYASSAENGTEDILVFQVMRHILDVALFHIKRDIYVQVMGGFYTPNTHRHIHVAFALGIDPFV